MGNKKGKTAKAIHVLLIFLFCFLVKRAGRHFGFFKRAGRHEKGAGRRTLQKKPRQNTDKHVTEDMFSLGNVTIGQVSKILHSMSSSKATGLDEIPAKYLKDGSSVISKLLTHIINLSITTGSIPDDLKMARIVPLYNKNSKTHVGNYRPISVLSVISKVFEKVVFMQLSDYLSENRLLYEFQSGFRSSYSTDPCLIHLTDYIKLENDKDNFTGMVLLDLQKAFDTVDHTILLNRDFGCR